MMMNRKWSLLIVGIIIAICFSGVSFGCPAPKVDSLSVNQGVNTETVELTINGSSFHKSTYVKLIRAGEPDILADNVKVVSAKQVTCSLNLTGKTAGQWDVVVANIGTITKKDKPTVIAKGFTIENPGLNVTGIEPQKATNDSVVNMVIHGDHFRSGARVVLSSGQMDIGAANIKINSDTIVTCSVDLKGAATGIYTVKVMNDDGKTGVLANSFTVDNPVTMTPEKKPAPAINTVVPSQGYNDGKVFINIAGTGFDPKAVVKLTGNGPEDIPGLNVKVESDTRLGCYFDISAKPAGRYNVVLINPDKQSAVLNGGFTVAQFVAQVDPNQLLKPVFFDYDKAELRSDQLESIDSDVVVLKDNPKLYILLGGHADERGTREYNLELSRQRAEIIKQYLVGRGVSPEQIVIYAYGKDYPVKEGHNETTWSYNRRVDVIVYDTRPDKMSGIRNP
jgi:outer membrane protein OmpA-like peptidoglycan-associated protein